MYFDAIVARAGGGHSFSPSGGGGSSGSSFHSGGGGLLFFGGGNGGGGGAGIAAVIVIILVLGVIFVALRSARRRSSGVRGSAPASTRTSGSGDGVPSGQAGSSGDVVPSSQAGASGAGGPTQWVGDDRPAIRTISGSVFADSGAGATTPQVGPEEGLAAIEAHDPRFNQERFLEDVQRAFFIVQEAWTKCKPDMSRQVMADGLWQQHRMQIEGYVSAHKHNVLDQLAVGQLTVVAADSDERYDTITVRVLAACADYDVDDESGKVIRGNSDVTNWQEDWTFQRSSKAVTPEAGGTLSARCPNCGAPLDLDLAGVCHYCKAPVMSGLFDWVLSRIAQL